MKEKEKKFLLIEKEFELLKHLYLHIKQKPDDIKQAYLMLDKTSQLRVRIINNSKAFICYKNILSQGVRDEFEYEIPLKDGQQMYKIATIKLQKKRISFDMGKYHIDIDYYPSGKKVVEVEYTGSFDYTPPFCGKYVSGVKEYNNIWIAMNEQNKKEKVMIE